MNDTSESNYEMLQALYDYKDTSSERTLDFKMNDEFFIYRDVADKKSWCYVINHTGDLGYVPYNYVKTIYVKNTHVLKFLDNCVLAVQQKLDVNDNFSDKFKLYQSLLRRQKKLKQKSSYNILDTPIQCKITDEGNQSEANEQILNETEKCLSVSKKKEITIPDVYEVVQQV